MPLSERTHQTPSSTQTQHGWWNRSHKESIQYPGRLQISKKTVGIPHQSPHWMSPKALQKRHLFHHKWNTMARRKAGIYRYFRTEQGTHKYWSLYYSFLLSQRSPLCEFHSLTLSSETLWPAPHQWPLKEDSVLNLAGTKMSQCWPIWTNIIDWRSRHYQYNFFLVDRENLCGVC